MVVDTMVEQIKITGIIADENDINARNIHPNATFVKNSILRVRTLVSILVNE